MSKEMLVALLVVAQAMLLLLLLPKVVVGNSATATNANKLGGKSSTEYITKGNFAVLTGTITMPEAEDENLLGTTTVNYPSGFTKDNCIVVSIMSHNTVHTDWWATPQTPSSSSMLLGNGDTKVILKPSGITIMSAKVASVAARKDVTYKLVIMKIS